MHQFRVVLAKIFKPTTIKPLVRLTTHKTHHGLKMIERFFLSPHYTTKNLMTFSSLMLLSQLNLSLGLKQLHFEQEQSRHSHAIQMHQFLDQVDTVISKEQSIETAESFCFQQIGTIEPEMETNIC